VSEARAAYILSTRYLTVSDVFASDRGATMTSNSPREKIVKPDEEWRATLTPEQYYVTRQGGTERAFAGPYWNEKQPGHYHCVGCGVPLFHSSTKFDSGTGWPSFHSPIEPGIVEEHHDDSYGMRRTEVRCSTCDAHLGHVFPDGPHPTGLRYCMNGTALKHNPDES
jgi:peptide-methionine (R)-S-oxide reductase